MCSCPQDVQNLDHVDARSIGTIRFSCSSTSMYSRKEHARDGAEHQFARWGQKIPAGAVTVPAIDSVDDSEYAAAI